MGQLSENRSLFIKIAVYTLSYLGVFLLAMILFTKNNNFNVIYHPDEPGKVYQVKTNSYNLHHPLLMLNATRLAVAVTGAEKDQDVAEIGRTVSALFGAFSIILIMISLNMTLGLPAAFSAGLLATFSPLIVQAAHIFKEDISLLFGITAVILSISLYDKFRNRTTLALTGISAALAASSKYIGLIFLPVALFFLLSDKTVSNGLTRRKRALTMLAVFFLASSLLNYQAFYYKDYISEKLSVKLSKTFRKPGPVKKPRKVNLKDESTDISIANTRPLNRAPGNGKKLSGNKNPKDHDRGGLAILTGHGGVVSRSPLKEYIRKYFNHTVPAIPVLAILFFIIMLIKRNEITVQLKVMFTVFFIYFLVISLGKSTASRYFIPISLLTHVFAALGIIKMTELLGKKFNRVPVTPVSLFLVLILIIPAYSRAAKMNRMFDTSRDNRNEMITWLESNIHSEAVIAADSYTRLKKMVRNIAPEKRKKITVKEMTYTGDLESIGNARKLGITHIVVCSKSYNRFFNKNLVSSSKATDTVSMRRKFYSELFKNGLLVWESRYPDTGSLNPAIKIYQLEKNQ